MMWLVLWGIVAPTLPDKDSYFAYGPVWGLVFILLAAFGVLFWVVRIEIIKPIIQSTVEKNKKIGDSFESMAESHKMMSNDNRTIADHIREQTVLLRKIAENTEHTPELKVRVAEVVDLVKKSHPHI